MSLLHLAHWRRISLEAAFRHFFNTGLFPFQDYFHYLVCTYVVFLRLIQPKNICTKKKIQTDVSNTPPVFYNKGMFSEFILKTFTYLISSGDVFRENGSLRNSRVICGTCLRMGRNKPISTKKHHAEAYTFKNWKWIHEKKLASKPQMLFEQGFP